MVETLIAGVMLFLAVAVATLAYRQTIFSAQRSNALLSIAGELQSIRLSVQEQLRLNPENLSGEGKQGQVQYQWRQTNSRSVNSQPGANNDAGGVTNTGSYRIILRDIEVTIEVVNNRRRVMRRTETFRLLDWGRA